MYDHKIIFLKGRKERTGCTEAAFGRSSLHLCNLHPTQLLPVASAPPSGKYGIAILERFDIPGESVKSGGKKDLSLLLYPLLYVTICERLCESPICRYNIFNYTCTYMLRNCISSSSWLDICELQIHLHRCTHCHLDGCKVSLGSSAPREECGARGLAVGLAIVRLLSSRGRESCRSTTFLP